MNCRKITFMKVIRNIGGRHLLALVLSVVLSAIAIGMIGNMLFRSEQAKCELRGEMDVIESAERFNEYLAVDRNALIAA